MVGAAFVACLCATAQAEDRAKAQTAYHSATQHYKLGEYSEALEGFKEAYRNYEDPIFIFDLAQCHRQLGHKEQAARAYRMFLIETPDAPNREKVRNMIATLEKQLAEERGGRPRPVTPQEEPSKNTRAPAQSESAEPNLGAPEVKSEPQRPAVDPEPAPQPVAIDAEPAPQPVAINAGPPLQPAVINAPQPVAINARAPKSPTPLYKRWWLWTAVGVVVVVGAGVGVGVGVSQSGRTPTAMTDLGTFRFE